MALINCSECGKQISSTAKKCPQCGNPISTASPVKDTHIGKISTSAIIPNDNSQNKTNGKLIFSLIAVLIVSVLGLIIYNLNRGPSGNEFEARENNIHTQDSLIETSVDKTTKENILVDSISNELLDQEATSTSDGSNEISKTDIRNRWYDYIKAEHSSYTYREIGGIEDLYITVTNDSDYMLDEVETSISYIKSNGTVYKTESVYFSNIPAHTWKKVQAPNSDRGLTVDYLEILNIKSSSLNFCYAPGNWAANSTDPYKCN